MQTDVSALRRELDGTLLLPADPGYDAARQVWNAMVDRRPAAIARCATPDDVVAAIRSARADGLEIGVKCGGHSVVGLSVPDGGLMIDLTPMDEVTVDPERRTATVGGGALLGALDRASEPYGLATTAGNVSHTGVGGLTLGGGMGWLARKYGLSCDNVLAYDVVLADGSQVRATAEEYPDLFWGLRGGGGNFGVVTQFTFRLHDTGTTTLSADYYHPLDDAGPVMRRWRDLIPDAPREATLTAWVGTDDSSPFIPEAWRGRPLVAIGFVWVGDVEEGRRLVPRFADIGRPIAEDIAERSYVELQSLYDSPEGHGDRRYWKGHILPRLDEAAIEAFISRGAATDGDPSMLPSGSFQSYGGAIGDVDDDASAYSQRDAFVEFVTGPRWTDPGEDEARMAAARRYASALEPFASGVYVNALSDEGMSGVQRAYKPAKLARLTAIKRQYDPDNVFHLNHNIRP
jgi:hypothetical protein